MSDEHEHDDGREHACGALPEPTPEHESLLGVVGTWTVDCTYFMAPGEPMKVQAKETIEALGRFWTVSLFESDFMGLPFAGRATTGFDPKRGKWVGTWVDSMMPHMFVMEGERDAESGIVTMHCDGPAPMTGDMVPYRSTTENLADGRRRFEMFMTLPEAGEVKMFSYVYTRAP